MATSIGDSKPGHDSKTMGKKFKSLQIDILWSLQSLHAYAITCGENN